MTRREYNSTVKSSSNRLYAYALKLTRDGARAQDLVQDSFVKLWENREKVNVDGAKPFLYRVLYNKMVDNYRKNKRISQPETMPDQRVEAEDYGTKDLVHRALNQLKESEKAIILLRDWEGYSYDDISQTLDLSASQVKVYLFRARKKMKAIVINLQASPQVQQL